VIALLANPFARLGAIVIGAVVALALGAAWHNGRIEAHKAAVTAAADARWRAAIELANEATRKAQQAARDASDAADARLREQADAMHELRSELEKANARLPGGDDECLSVERLRLLNRYRGPR
jgi:hypothetical protein